MLCKELRLIAALSLTWINIWINVEALPVDRSDHVDSTAKTQSSNDQEFQPELVRINSFAIKPADETVKTSKRLELPAMMADAVTTDTSLPNDSSTFTLASSNSNAPPEETHSKSSTTNTETDKTISPVMVVSDIVKRDTPLAQRPTQDSMQNRDFRLVLELLANTQSKDDNMYDEDDKWLVQTDKNGGFVVFEIWPDSNEWHQREEAFSGESVDNTDMKEQHDLVAVSTTLTSLQVNPTTLLLQTSSPAIDYEGSSISPQTTSAQYELLLSDNTVSTTEATTDTVSSSTVSSTENPESTSDYGANEDQEETHMGTSTDGETDDGEKEEKGSGLNDAQLSVENASETKLERDIQGEAQTSTLDYFEPILEMLVK